MRGKEKRQGDFLSHAGCDSLIPPDHSLRRLRALLDWEALAGSIQMLLASMAANLKRWLGMTAPAVATAG